MRKTPQKNTEKPAQEPEIDESAIDPTVAWSHVGQNNPYSGNGHDKAGRDSGVNPGTTQAAPPPPPDKVDPEANSDSYLSADSTAPTPAEIDAEDRAAAKAAKKAAKQAAREARREEAERKMLEREAANDLPDVRRVKLTLARINPLSAMKVGFLVAVALSIVMLVASIVLWLVLDMLHVFSSMQGFLQALSATAVVNLVDALTFSRTLAFVAIFGVLQIVILTVLSWLAAVIYNLIARMVGGLHVVMTDE